MTKHILLLAIMFVSCGCGDTSSPTANASSSRELIPDHDANPAYVPPSQTESDGPELSDPTTIEHKTSDADSEVETSGASEQSKTDADADDATAADKPTDDATKPSAAVSRVSEDGYLKLNPNGTVLFDRDGGRLLLKTEVCLRDGVLEMLLCQPQTKEHESILKIDAKSYVVHAGLVALGAKPGRPVQTVPEFSPPQGHELDVFVSWKSADGKTHRNRAQDWLRYSVYRYFEFEMKKLPDGFKLPDDDEMRYDDTNGFLLWFGPMKEQKRDELLKLSDDKQYQQAVKYFYQQGISRPMKAKFVFAGSSFFVDEDTGERSYRGEGGHLICVANFPAATIDVSMQSSAVNETQMFEAWTDRIPPKGTPVTVELIPVPQPADASPKPKSQQDDAQDQKPTPKDD